MQNVNVPKSNNFLAFWSVSHPGETNGNVMRFTFLLSRLDVGNDVFFFQNAGIRLRFIEDLT